MASTASPPIENAEITQQRLRAWLESLQALAESPIDNDRFYGELLARLTKAVSADGGRFWTQTPDGGWRCNLSFGLDASEESAESAQQRRQLFQNIMQSGRSAAAVLPAPVDAAGLPTSSAVWQPIAAAGVPRGILEFRVRVVTEAAQAGVLRFLTQAAAVASHFHLLADRREYAAMASVAEGERKFYLSAHRHLDLRKTARVLVDDGRVLLGCDRLTLLVGKKRRQRVVAVSGQEDFDRRSPTIAALRKLAVRAVSAKRDLVFPEGQSDCDPTTIELFERYVDESDVKRIVVRPLRAPPPEKETVGRAEPPILGVVIVEYFRQLEAPAGESARLELVARCASTALRNSLEHESIFLHGLWSMLGRWRAGLLEKGSLRRALLITMLIASAVAAAIWVPVDDTTYCRGTLQPVARRNVFTPLDGTVRKVFVAHGRRVKRGEPLVELRNTELEIAQTDLEGKQRTAAEQLLAVERSLLDNAQKLQPQERARLAGEQSELREQLASYKRQAELFEERRRQLMVASPVDGEVTTWDVERLLGNRPVRQGQVLLTLAAVEGNWELKLNVPDDRSGRVVKAAATSADPLRVTFSPALDPGATYEAQVVEIENSADVRGEEGNTVLVRAEIPPADAMKWRPGAEVAAHIHCGRAPLGYVWTRGLADFVRTKILFRWF